MYSRTITRLLRFTGLLITVMAVIVVCLAPRFVAVPDIHPTDEPVFWLVEDQTLNEAQFREAVTRGSMDLNQKTSGGITPLHHAVYYNHKAISYLIHAGANVDAKDENGQTPLMLAVLSKRRDEVDDLVRNGATVNLRDKSDRSALDLAKNVCAEDRRACSIYFDLQKQSTFASTNIRE